MQLNATKPAQPEPTAMQKFLDKAGPWAAMFGIAYIVFKGGRYGA